MYTQLHFQHISNAWWFTVLVPAMFIWMGYMLWRKRVERRSGDAPLMKNMIVGYNGLRHKLKAALVLCAVALIAAALMNPERPDENTTIPTEGLTVMLVMDVSNSMTAEDVTPNRLEKARLYAQKLTDGLAGSRIGLVVFAGQPLLQMPPTTDVAAVRFALESARPELMPFQGTNIDAALQEANRAMQSLEQTAKAVILITDGEELEGKVLNEVQTLADGGMVIFAAGVGNPEGTYLPPMVGGQVMQDEEGKPVQSKLDEAVLKKMASVTGGNYILIDNIESQSAATITQLQKLDKLPIGNRRLMNFYTYAPWLMLLALLFLLIDWFWPERVKPRRVKLQPGIKTVPLSLLLLVFLLPQLAISQVSTHIRKGNKAYRNQQYDVASDQYEKALQLDSAQPVAKFTRANIDYLNGNAEKAAASFAQQATAEKAPALVAAAWNNAGLALAKQENYKEALLSFRNALRAAPYDEEIRRNLQKALSDLAKQEPPPQPKPDDPKPQKQPKPLKPEDVDRKLNAIKEDEKKTRQKMKPSNTDQPAGKNW